MSKQRIKVIKLHPDKDEYFYSFLNGEIIETGVPENGLDVGGMSDDELLVLGARIVEKGFDKLLMVAFFYYFDTGAISKEQRFTRTTVDFLMEIANQETEESEWF